MGTSEAIHHPLLAPTLGGALGPRHIYPVIIFLVAYFLRVHFFCGFILGDDVQEFECVRLAFTNSINLADQFQLRFGGWVFNWLFFKLMGISETSFFLPTWLMSASFGVIGYFILVYKKYDSLPAFLTGLLIASAPFEILIGTVRANDLILSWLIALGLLFFLYLESKPLWQGICTAFFFWICFYVKLWIVYLLPGLGIYYLIKLYNNKEWRGVFGFTFFSFVLHGVTCTVWKIKLGSFLPFIHNHAATYPVASKDLPHLFKVYPEMIFKGSEFGTTLFGAIPYLLITGVLVKILLAIQKKKRPFDELDCILIGLYGSFFLLVNFFPNSFQFDQYYSAPRIFRYLTPISFPMALHTGKLIYDSFTLASPRFSFITFGNLAVCIVIICLNLVMTDGATKPGQIYRDNLRAIVADIQSQSPPVVLVEYWLSHFMRAIYLKDSPQIRVIEINGTYHSSQYEEWLDKNQYRYPPGTMLITGLGSYLYYGAHYDGFHLTQFKRPLNPAWKLFKEYGVLDYLPIPEQAKIWQLSRPINQDKEPPPRADNLENHSNPISLFQKGMELFDKQMYSNAQRYYHEIYSKFEESPEANNALYYHAICFFRQGDWKNTISDFTKLIDTYPQSHWVSGAYYHIGISQKSLNNNDQARDSFEYVIKHFPNDSNLVDLSKTRLQNLPQ